ncbi:LLM class flavin-dependent oxidoreductase [Snodgrassella sp. B3800]|uniref:LLM class flavin-dependent oxidoreductase n=1 Tax=Snodgrassella TaxID=1193515 RepID=UPI002269B48D|nr:LLM class flavin-dependent oxidoreductase [Snodgrassella sp. B3800]
MAIPVSILNLVPRRDNGTAASAIRDMLRLAQVAEQLGFVRYWIAEHHNMPMVVSSATQILIGHTLSHTHHIRVGSGGVMLPNHSPLLVAEQYGTLATIYPHRVDLGLGRAPGTDRVTAAALRRQLNDVSLKFADDVVQLQRYLGDEQQQGLVKAYPGMGTHIPLYILGSSTDSAYLAASLGLPYVFAAHFAPRFLDEAAAIYRERFQPSAQLAAPFFMLCLNLVAAATDDEALYLQTTQLQSVLGLIRNNRKALHQPVPSMDGLWTAEEEAYVRNFTACTLLGAPETVRQQLEGYVLRLQPDEVMAVSYIYDMDKLLESYNIFKTVADNVG